MMNRIFLWCVRSARFIFNARNAKPVVMNFKKAAPLASAISTSKWQSFAESTSIHGLIYVNEGFQRHRFYRFIWLAIVLLCLTCCIYQSAINIQDYLKFNVSISTSFENRNLQPYPAITFWNENMIKRTVIGRKSLMLMAAKILGTDDEGAKKVYTLINRTCLYEPKNTDAIDEIISHFDLVELSRQSQQAMMASLQYVSVSREDSFVKCWYNRTEIECEKLVLTTLADISMTFSININSMLSDNFINNESGVGFANTKFDKNMTNMISSNKGDGFQFLLNAMPDEYCAHAPDYWYGVGIHMKFHDPFTLPSVEKGTSIFLHPGYKYDVSIKAIQHVRYTEHIDLCLSSFSLYVFPETETYFQELCYIQCESEYSWKYCGCIATMIKSAATAFGKHHRLNETEYSHNCKFYNPSCAYNLGYGLMNQYNVEKYICPQCKIPCRETEYSYQLTGTIFPPKQHFLHQATNMNVIDGEFIRKNHIMLNIFFESNLVNMVKEYQSFTFKEMWIYIGNNIGLFLGMSFMSIFEILQLFAEEIIMKSRKRRNWFRNDKRIRVRNIVVVGLKVKTKV